MHDVEWMHSWGGMWFGPLLMFGLPILLIVLLVWLFRQAGDGRPGHGTSRTPRDVLDERFARGEIDEDEYRKRRDVLNS